MLKYGQVNMQLHNKTDKSKLKTMRCKSILSTDLITHFSMPALKMIHFIVMI